MARLFILFGAVAIQQWGISGLNFSFMGELERGVEGEIIRVVGGECIINLCVLKNYV